jgi:hypothetical protein
MHKPSELYKGNKYYYNYKAMQQKFVDSNPADIVSTELQFQGKKFA